MLPPAGFGDGTPAPDMPKSGPGPRTQCKPAKGPQFEAKTPNSRPVRRGSTSTTPALGWLRAYAERLSMHCTTSTVQIQLTAMPFVCLKSSLGPSSGIECDCTLGCTQRSIAVKGHRKNATVPAHRNAQPCNGSFHVSVLRPRGSTDMHLPVPSGRTSANQLE